MALSLVIATSKCNVLRALYYVSVCLSRIGRAGFYLRFPYTRGDIAYNTRL